MVDYNCVSRSVLTNSGCFTPSLIKLVVFDFDLTLTKIHTWHSGIKTKREAATYDADYVRNELFADFELLCRCIESFNARGIQVAIATYQYSSVVETLLDIAFNKKSPIGKDWIMARDTCKGDKFSMLKKLSKKLGLVDGDVVVFFDDDADNIAKIKQKRELFDVGPRFKPFLVPKSVHFTQQFIDTEPSLAEVCQLKTGKAHSTIRPPTCSEVCF